MGVTVDRILRVLIVDDSAYVRKVIKQMLTRSPFIEVVGTARDAEEALALVPDLHPDVITLDLIMPGIGGLGFIREQLSRVPLPIVVVSIASETSQSVLDALDAGAIDFVQKPSALATEKVFEMADDLIQKVKAAGNVRLGAVKTAPAAAGATFNRPATGRPQLDIVVIGISTGGPQALKYLIPRLPADFPLPIGIAMHMPVGYTELYAKRLNELSAFDVYEAQEGTEVRRGCVLIAPAGRHLTFIRKDSGVVAHVDARPFDTLHRPSVDVLFRSAAETFGNRVLGVVMTGMGDDGREGASLIKTKGGIIFAEAEESCVVFGMPRVIIEAGLSNRTVPLARMPEAILEAVYGDSSDRR
jgi:two-component system, chemotaxis family, protein-glutamate methylesterase/glutaminase